MNCSVAYVSRSGGMSNELNNIVCLNADGAYEGVAIGGDRYHKQHFLGYQLVTFIMLIHFINVIISLVSSLLLIFW